MKILITGLTTGLAALVLSGCVALQPILQPWTTWTPSEDYRVNRVKHFSMNVKVTPKTAQNQGYVLNRYDINGDGIYDVIESYKIISREKNIVASKPWKYEIDTNADGIIDKIIIDPEENNKTASNQ